MQDSGLRDRGVRADGPKTSVPQGFPRSRSRPPVPQVQNSAKLCILTTTRQVCMVASPLPGGVLSGAASGSVVPNLRVHPLLPATPFTGSPDPGNMHMTRRAGFASGGALGWEPKIVRRFKCTPPIGNRTQHIHCRDASQGHALSQSSAVANLQTAQFCRSR
jgi:hypothetical protein